MKNSNTIIDRFLYWGVCVWVGARARRIRQLFFYTRPSGYDAGLYRELYQSYTWLSHWLAFSELPEWIVAMYPPLLWWISRLFSTFGASIEWQVYFFPVMFSLLLAGCVYRLVSYFGRRAWLFACMFYLFSFAQYSVYRWHYVKQLLAACLVLLVLWWWLRKRFWIAIPFIAWVILSHRPAIAVVCMLFVGGVIQVVREKKMTDIWQYLYSFVWGCLIALPFYWYFIDVQIASLLPHLWQSIDVPTLQDSYQQGGTFLTIGEYVTVGWPILIMWVGGLFVLRKDQEWWLLCRLIGVFGIWVLLQLFFFQRMLWYLDLFLLCAAWVFAEYLLSKSLSQAFSQAVLFGLIASHVSLYFTWVPRVAPPIIEKEEFAFLTHIDRFIEDDSLIIVPWIWYSPWVAWWSDATVVAPWLFDTNVRGNEDEWRKEYWFDVTTAEKCENIKEAFGDVAPHMYVRVWSKQEREILTGECFSLIYEENMPYHAVWKISP